MAESSRLTMALVGCGNIARAHWRGIRYIADRIDEPEKPEGSQDPADELRQSVLRLPNELIRLPVRTGAVTRDLIFLTDRTIRILAKVPRSKKNLEETWPHGPAYVKEWKHGDSLLLHPGPKGVKDAPYRIVFAIDPNGDVLPVQQCVNVLWESAHEVSAEAWCRDTAFLTGSYEMTSVSEQLNALAESKPSKEQTVVCYSCDGPVRTLLVTGFEPAFIMVMWKSLAGTCEELIKRVTEITSHLDNEPGEMIALFGQWGPPEHKTWCVVYAGPICLGKDKGLNTRIWSNWFSDIVNEYSWWTLAWGSGEAFWTRTVLTLFAPK